MSEDWLDRWANGRTGWHEEDGNAGLKAHWPSLESTAKGRNRVLVPLCGKTPDLLWLAEQGHEVVGIELSEIAIRQLFAEHDLTFRVEEGEVLKVSRIKISRGLIVYSIQDVLVELSRDSGLVVVCCFLKDRNSVV